MLVLGRNQGDKILINDNLILTIVEIKGGKVRIGFEAPKDVIVTRFELLPPHVQENAVAATRSS